MVECNGTPITSRRKRTGRGWRRRQKARNRIRRKSRELVKSGRIHPLPCLRCGSRENLTIHHLEPFAPGRFVWLCEPCHRLAHTPVYRTIQVTVARGQFSVRPEAAVRRHGEVRRG